MSEEQGHSPFGGSKAHIWLRCSKSVEESAKWPPAPSSPYAEKGTDAHALAAHCLVGGDRDASIYVGAEINRADSGKFTVTAEMATAVNVYIGDVWANLNFGHDEFFVEQKFSILAISDQAYGHNDAAVYKTREQELWLWDFKGGAGIFVEAEGNEQGAFYMVGAALEHFIDRPLRRVVITIIQPNFDCEEGPIRRWTLEPYEIFDWFAKFKAAHDLANSDKATWVVGKHCRWCAGAAGCDALHLAATTGLMQGQAVIPPDPKQMTALEIGHRLRQLDIIELYGKVLRERAYSEAVAGRPPHGWKLVDKRATRKWISDDAIEQLPGIYRGLTLDELYHPRKPLSPPQVEKLVGKESMTLIKDLIVKESSGKTLVPDTDERPEVKTGFDADFGDIIPATPRQIEP